ncbi:hypothetical protein C8F01DRAFT_1233190 [Mycena amicta]|nr:hypothetical protein C8F01DRAFT_1233190 [Mycena amicta]
MSTNTAACTYEASPTTQYYVRFALHIMFAVGFSLTSVFFDAREHTNEIILAALVKLALMAVVWYLPGYGPLKLRLAVSDACQWVLFIISVAITISVDGNPFVPEISLPVRLFCAYMSFIWAFSWNSLRRLEQAGSMHPLYLLWASLRRRSQRERGYYE